MNYKYISIPTSRLSEEWLKNNNFDPEEDIGTFITYRVASDSYGHYNFVKTAVAQHKLERIL